MKNTCLLTAGWRLALLLVFLVLCANAFAALTGTKNIPGDYATITLAVAALNSQGVGAGGVTFYVAANYTETITARINLTATGTSANPIVFRKSGAGSNPKIIAYVGTATPASATPDGIWSLVGSDYVTIQNIDLYDPNTTNPATMEYGYGLFKAGGSDGVLYSKIASCVVTLNRVNNASGTAPMVEGSVCILVINSTPTAATTALTPTNAYGSNTSNQFYANTLQNCNYGIVLNGYAATGTADVKGDHNNIIGNNSNFSLGNTILNFGGGGSVNAAAGIRANNQWGVLISHNTINNNDTGGVNHANILRGIYTEAGTGASANITYNNVTVKGGGTTTAVYGIDNGIGSTPNNNIVSINDNTITGAYTTATSGAFYAINNSATAYTVNINNNTTSSISTPGTGAIYGIKGGSSTGSLNANYNNINTLTKTGIGAIYGIYQQAGTVTAQNNTIDGLSCTVAASTASVTGMYSYTGSLVENLSNNVIRNFSSTGTAQIQGISLSSGNGNKTIQNNLIYNFTVANGAGAITGIRKYSGVTDIVSDNTIYSLSITGTTSGFLYGVVIAAGTTNSIYNNKISTLSNAAGTAGSVYGINYSAASSTASIYKNKIYDLYSGGTSSYAFGIYTSNGTTCTIYNNLIGDFRTPYNNVANKVIGIYLNSSATNYVYYNTVYLNSSSNGAVFGSVALQTSATATLNLRNNILVNLSTPNGTGYVAALGRETNYLPYYASTSNNNLFYAGTGTNHYVYYNGTAGYTFAGFKSLVTPRDNVSATENPSFISTTGADADFLHINTGVQTYVESGAGVIATFTDDYDGVIRSGNIGYLGTSNNPDIGAVEGEFIGYYPPGVANILAPADAATGILPSQVLSWNPTSGLPTSYDVYFGNSTPPALVGNQAGTTYSPALVNGQTYYWKIVPCNSSGAASEASIWSFTTVQLYNVTIDTGNITGVRIYTDAVNYGVDPVMPIVLTSGFNGTFHVEKTDYVWNLPDGAGSNVITSLSVDTHINFIGTYTYVDPNPENLGFIYTGEANIPLTAAASNVVALASSGVPLPAVPPVNPIVVVFTGTTPSNVTISVPAGIWYVIAYYNDPTDGGLTWHHGNPYPVTGAADVVFTNVPFAAKSDIPVIITGTDATLPVELSSFTAVLTAQNYVNLTWTTQSETDLSGYYIYRSKTAVLSDAELISALIPATNTSSQQVYVYQDTEVEGNATYNYWLQATELNSTGSFHGPVSVMIGEGGEIVPPPAVDSQTCIDKVYPNPFNPQTQIGYNLKTSASVTLMVYNHKGQLIRTLVNANKVSGYHRINWDGKDSHGIACSSGVYYVKMLAGSISSTRKMVLLK